MITKLIALALVLMSAKTDTYSDPNGAYSLTLPSGWKADQNKLDTDVYLTECYSPSDEEGAHIDILSRSSSTPLDPSSYPTVTSGVISLITELLKADGQIISQKQSETSFNGTPATKVEISFKDGDGVSWKGWMVVMCSPKHVVALMPYAKASDSASMKVVEDSANTLSFAGKSGSTSGGKGLLTKAALAKTASLVKSNMKRDSMDKVLADGEPPLTYGSVANFVTVMELLFDIQMTETEFEATKERFLEYYAKADAKGKQVLALQGTSLLKGATEGTPEEIAENRRQGKAVFENGFKKGAEMGIGYAQVMWDAIQRRSSQVASAKGTPKNDGWDTQVSEADLDATIEMLYFMWVASGRSASDVTPEAITVVRASIVQNFAAYPQEVQLIIANAQKVYAGMRQQYQSATPQMRLLLAQQYGGALDSMGLKEGGQFEEAPRSSGGGSDGSAMAALAQNTAWNAAKTWTTTSSN